MSIQWIMNTDTAQRVCTDTARSVHTNGIHWIMNNDTARSVHTNGIHWIMNNDTSRSVHTNGYTLDHE